MNIPNQVKVGGIKYRVKIVDSEDFDGKTGAQIISDKSLIKVLKGDRAFMEECFLHELFHAINMEFEETIVEFFSQSLYQIIVDNPTLFKEQLKGGEAQHE